MEETRLDKIVGKVFNRLENATKFLFDEPKKGKAFLYVMLMQLFLGITMILLLFTSANNPNQPMSSKVLRYLQIPAMIIPPLFFLFTKLKNISDLDLKILKFSQKFYSAETTKLCFEPIIADWKMEYSTAVSQNLNWNARWISIRYASAYLSAMLMQTRIGRLLQIIFKS